MSVSLSSVSTSSFDAMADSGMPVIAVKIMPSTASAARRNFHLALILDTSGSMAGDRILAVKRTLHLLVDAMEANDIITMIEYSTNASIIANCVSISDESRVVLHTTVDAMNADGGTNMESAFLKLREVSSTSSIDSVFVMTDGQINQGCSSSIGLTRILTASVPSGTPINTLGYGHDHNIRLLRDIGVRSRGSYTYADSDELIPAIIGDITGGLAAEVGRNARLVIPSGWKCLELGFTEGDTSYSVGTLIAEKPQWIVLKGPVKRDIPVLPTFTLTWSSGGVEHTETSVVNTDAQLTAVDAAEQELRASIVTTFDEVSTLLESGDYTAAKARLEGIAAIVDASSAKDRTLVIQMRAQIDDMLDAVSSYTSYNHHIPGAIGLQNMPHPMTAWPLMPAHAPVLQHQNAAPSLYNAIPPPPALAPVLSRLASNTTTLGVQRGILSGQAAALHATFSSPSQRHASRGLTQQYSQAVADDVDITSESTAILPNLSALNSSRHTVLSPILADPSGQHTPTFPTPLTPTNA